MKRSLFILLFFIFTLDLYANEEIQRIDSMVHDIAMLRKSYEEKLVDAKEKNIILQQEQRAAQRKIKNLENQIKELKSLLKNREIEKKDHVVSQKKSEKIVLKEVCPNENEFPQLKLKKGVLQYFKASAFRLKESANIYAGPNTMQVLQTWEKHTSFTSNLKTSTRIKITGYFVNKKWTKATDEMWVDLTDVEPK